MRQRQVGAGAPGPRAEVPLALAAVGARGVVLTLTLQAALAHGAQAGVQVALAPGGWGDTEAREVSALGRQVGTDPGKREHGQEASTPLQDKKIPHCPALKGALHSSPFQGCIELLPEPPLLVSSPLWWCLQGPPASQVARRP